MIPIWVLIFIVSLIALVKGSDWLIKGAENIGLALGLSSFIVGVTIISIGTSLPELVYNLAAVIRGVTEMVPANVVGSNIANIYLVIGVATLIQRKLDVKMDIINVDLPLLACATVLFLALTYDRQVIRVESIVLLVAYAAYLIYTISQKQEKDIFQRVDFGTISVLNKHSMMDKNNSEGDASRHKILFKEVLLLVCGIVLVSLGAKYLTESVIRLSVLLNVGVGLITITAVAIGTSLPELVVSVKAVRMGKTALALGNIMGSCIFNMLVVVGLPGIFRTLVLGDKTFTIGLPVMISAVVLFVISGISRVISIWEGLFFLIIYFVFIMLLFGVF